MGLFSLGEDPEIQKLADQRSKGQAVVDAATGGLLTPKTPVQQLVEEDGALKTTGKMMLNVLTGGLLTPLLHPELGSRKAQYETDLGLYKKQLESQVALQAAQAERDRLSRVYDDWHAVANDDDPTNDARGYIRAINNGADVDAMALAYASNPLFAASAAGDMPDIMRTTNAYVESHNEANPDKPITFHEGYDIVKNYDAGRRGEQTTAVETAKSDVQQFQASRDAYITAVEQDAVLTDRIANVDKGIQLLESGAVDTGPVVGYLAETFGMGSQDLAALQQMGLEEAMEALQAFKGPTTDFEFGKAELKSFAQIFKGEDLNIGTLKSARDSLEKIRKRNMLSGMSHLDAVGQYGSAEQGERLRGVFKTPESWLGETQKPEATEQQSGQVSGAPSYSQFEQDARARGITDPVMISAKYKELYGG